MRGFVTAASAACVLCCGGSAARAHDLGTVDRLLSPPHEPIVSLAADVRALRVADSTHAMPVRSVAATSVGLSLLLPGLGHLHDGHTTRGAAFLVIEAALWTTVAVSEVQSGLRTDHAHEQAQVFAHVSTGPHADQFYRDVSRYRSNEDYNVQVRRDARNSYAGPDSLLPSYVDAYEQTYGYFGDSAWHWDSFSSFQEYGDLRSAAQDASRRAAFAIGGALANRLFAIIDVTRGHARPRSTSASPVRLDVAGGPRGRTTCAITARF